MNIVSKSSTPSFVALSSGRGSNIEKILDNISKGILNAKALAIITDNQKSEVQKLKNIYSIKLYTLSEESGEARDSSLEQILDDLAPDFIILSGYLKLIPKSVVKKFKNRIINIHPSLLPKHGGKGMYGLKVHESVLKSNDKLSGATIHIVTEKFDKGPIIAQAEVHVLPEDTAETLAARVLKLEHLIYTEAIKMYIKKYQKFFHEKSN